MSAFVFKIQANMDPNHRDRIAFVRLCSGKLTRGMKVTQVRTGKTIGLHAPQFFFAQNARSRRKPMLATLSAFQPRNAPHRRYADRRRRDQLRRRAELRAGDPTPRSPARRHGAKKLKQALQQLAEEGVAQVFRPTDGSPVLVGVVGRSTRSAQGKARKPNMDRNWLGHGRISVRALDRGRDREMLDRFVTEYHSRSPKISTAIWSSWHAMPSTLNIRVKRIQIFPSAT